MSKPDPQAQAAPKARTPEEIERIKARNRKLRSGVDHRPPRVPDAVAKEVPILDGDRSDTGPRERAQHGAKVVDVISEIDPMSGRRTVKRVVRAVDTLMLMFDRGTIDAPCLEAGRRFRDDFDLARLDPMRAQDLDRSPGGPGGASDAEMGARRRIHDDMLVLGGTAAPAAMALYWIVGAGCTVKEASMRLTWGGRPGIDHRAAQGLLVAALHGIAERRGLIRRAKAARMAVR